VYYAQQLKKETDQKNSWYLKINLILNMYLQDFIQKRESEFQEICRRFQVRQLFGFGSSVRMDFVPDQSDVDLLVQIDISDPLEKGEALLGLWDALETYFQRKVDLLTPDSLRNPFLKASIEKNKQLIYEG
jgi:predicted nucleotidyltransferase